MKQVIQDLRKGFTGVVDLPAPLVRRGCLLIRTRASLISPGTERMLLEFGRSNLLAKARQQPDKVKQVIAKIKTDGLLSTLEAVRAKLDQPLPLGYCNVGEVLEVGAGVSGFAPGDRVVSNGPHAEIICVPRNLCCPAPPGVGDEAAAFTVLGAVALQGLRLAQPTLGECFVVYGLGLIGLMTVQILRANGCRVLGLDLDPRRCALARVFGAEAVDLGRMPDPLTAAAGFSRGRGADGVLVTLSTQSDEPMHLAAQMCRKKGRLVLVGVAGLGLRRADYFEKELSFQVSCSYGPGRYDPSYEEEGRDYPLGHVRWTEQRNFEAVLDLLDQGRLAVDQLLTHRFPIAQAGQAYEVIAANREPYLGLLLTYPEAAASADQARPVCLPLAAATAAPAAGPVVGLIGAGGFTGQVLLKHLAQTKARLKTVVSAKGLSGTHLGRKFGFEQSATDVAAVMDDPEINCVFITTRHDSHGRLVAQALQRGKHVFVEKPLCITRPELAAVGEALARCGGAAPRLMVGFNRRFAPLAREIKARLGGATGPFFLNFTVNAGAIPPEHWVQDPQVGGGRIIGEVCHFIDLLRHLVGAPVAGWQAAAVGSQALSAQPRDSLGINLTFADGSLGCIQYLSLGHKSFPKERLEVFVQGRVLQLDNFRVLRGFGWPGLRVRRLLRQDKGHGEEIRAFIQAVAEGGPTPMTWEEIEEVTRLSFDLAEACQ